METYYLVDFENVHEGGLDCQNNQLGSHDHIHIFYTKNASKISFKSLEPLKNKTSEHEVPPGNQSLDMHLSAYLGYLIGKNSSQECKYIIISKDKGYDNVISFLKKYTHPTPTIVRRSKIITTSKKTAVTTKTASGKTSPSKKTQLNTEIQRNISASGYDKTVINKVASIVSKHYSEKHCLINVHNDLGKIYTDYRDIYQIIKPIIKKYLPYTTS